MKTHILLSLMALVITACASKEHQSAAKFEERQEKQEEFTLHHVEDPSARFR